MKVDLIQKLDCLVHKNKLVARKLQGTLVDDVYHRIIRFFGGT